MARDEALARAKNAEERAAKALNELRNYRVQGVCCCLLLSYLLSLT